MIDNSMMTDSDYFKVQERLYEQQLEKEESHYERLFSMLLMSGEYREQDIDAQVYEIMDNPHIYPEYFWSWLFFFL